MTAFIIDDPSLVCLPAGAGPNGRVAGSGSAGAELGGVAVPEVGGGRRVVREARLVLHLREDRAVAAAVRRQREAAEEDTALAIGTPVAGGRHEDLDAVFPVRGRVE